MNPLLEDLKRELVPEILVIDASDFSSEDEMRAYIKKHPAKHVIIVCEYGQSFEDEAQDEEVPG